MKPKYYLESVVSCHYKLPSESRFRCDAYKEINDKIVWKKTVQGVSEEERILVTLRVVSKALTEITYISARYWATVLSEYKLRLTITRQLD